jgi:hypothetical protein
MARSDVVVGLLLEIMRKSREGKSRREVEKGSREGESKRAGSMS